MEFSEELEELMKKRMAKSKRMEAAQGGGGGRGGGSEVRRIHIIYFLSRKGRIEHPHLVRVHHLSRNGIRLRDVKRWLSELRGKDMPVSFAWSYKRRYKTGFVWQDLLDEDLITPISDNEYVLKGSEIPSSDIDLRSHSEKKVPIQKDRSSTQERDPKLSRNKEQNDHHEEEEEEEEEHHHQQTTMDVSTTKTTSSEIEEESPPFGSETSTLTDESIKLEEEEEEEEEEKQSDSNKQETTTEQLQRDKFENSSSSLYSTTLLNKNQQKKKKNNNKKVVNPSKPASTATESSFTKSKSYSGGATNMFRSFITCGAVDTNDSAMVMLNKRDKMSSSSCYVPISKQDDDDNTTTTTTTTTAGRRRTQGICKGDKLGGSERLFLLYGTSWNQDQQQKTHPNPNPNANAHARKSFDGVKNSSNKKSEFNNQKPVSAAYRPVNGPNCSQCGKMFKPEKMHTHMKSCRGMKFLAKATSCSAAAAAASFEPRRSMDSSCEESVSGYYLAN